jgi:hypothetical protein
MRWQLLGALGAIAIFAPGTTTAAPAAPAACERSLQCRCAVAVGGTFDPRTNRWRVEEMNIGSFETCLSRGRPIGAAPTAPAQAKPGAKKRQ